MIHRTCTKVLRPLRLLVWRKWINCNSYVLLQFSDFPVGFVSVGGANSEIIVAALDLTFDAQRWPYMAALDFVSFRGTSREPQGLWASHTAQRTEQARSTLFTLLFFSSPGLEPNPARLEASVHSSLDLKHFTAGEH